MLRSLNDIRGYTLHATDGDIGRAADFLFDDRDWAVRYLVADTGRWLRGRLVLLSPVALRQADWASRRLHVDLTRSQIDSSPDIDSDMPVSRAIEHEIAQYYAWPVYWAPIGAPAYAGGTSAVPAGRVTGGLPGSEPPRHDPHLRSVKEVSGYSVLATDGQLGHIEDFIAQDDDWAIRYCVLDTGNWLPGRKVLVAADWIQRIDAERAEVQIDLDRESIRASPEYDANTAINREYEARLYDYYGRPKYWD